ncbi:MAG: glycosyltransferase family 4 protein [Gemmatimonadaceae bacterium]
MTTDARGDRLTIAMMIETVALGGAEQVVFQLSEELRSRGHVVHPVVPEGHEGWLLDRFREAGFQWHTYSTRRSYSPRLVRWLAALMRDLGVTAVHSHEFVMAVYGTAATKLAGVPHVITLHADQMMTSKLRKRIALRWAFRFSSSAVAVSQDTKRHLDATLGLRPGVVTVVPNGIPVRHGDAERARRSLQLSPNDRLILGVGSLIVRKGFDVAIRALGMIRAAGRLGDWRLAIAGQGVERDNLIALAKECGVEDRVMMLGPRTDIPDLQAAADIFVMPSRWEGLPIALLEAMFAGNAIVASGISGIPEAVDHERHGLLTPAGDVDVLQKALQRVIDDVSLRERLGKAALARAQEHFTIRAMTDLYEKLYRARAS